MLTPNGSRLLIEPIEKEAISEGGLIIPEVAQERPVIGEVKAVGPGEYDDMGILRVPDFFDGQRVLYSKYAGTEVRWDSVDYLIIRADDVLARIT